MSIDKSLSVDYPTVKIHGQLYQYGKVPEAAYKLHGMSPPYPDEWSVEHVSNAKDYWCFRRKDDLVAFLVNLPESADRDWVVRRHPDWNEVTYEERKCFIEEHEAFLRQLAEGKKESRLKFDRSIR